MVNVGDHVFIKKYEDLDVDHMKDIPRHLIGSVCKVQAIDYIMEYFEVEDMWGVYYLPISCIDEGTYTSGCKHEYTRTLRPTLKGYWLDCKKCGFQTEEN